MHSTQALAYHRSLTNALGHAQTRRGALRTSALAAGGAAALTLSGPSVLGFRAVAAQDFSGPVDVLNYALTLEHLESSFYRDSNAMFSEADFEDAGFDSAVYGRFKSIQQHESDHVDVLVSTISTLGGEPVGELMYSFGVTDVDSYVATAQVLENLGTGAYTGAAQFLIDEDELLTAALTIHGIEARHASYLNFLNGEVPFPESFEMAIAPADVLAAATPLIVSDMPTTGSGPITDRGSDNLGVLAMAGALGFGAAALAVRARRGDTSATS